MLNFIRIPNIFSFMYKISFNHHLLFSRLPLMKKQLPFLKFKQHMATFQISGFPGLFNSSLFLLIGSANCQYQPSSFCSIVSLIAFSTSILPSQFTIWYIIHNSNTTTLSTESSFTSLVIVQICNPIVTHICFSQ